MATSRLSDVVQHLRRVILLRDGAGRTDGQLLESFIVERDEACFAALVRRHAPMVWGVCWRILHNHQDAEDAFQAVFLVLVRKATSIVPRHMVANWLYGVAHQTALKVRATVAKRRGRERQVPEMPQPQAVQQDMWADLQPLLDQELSRLPDKYRVPIVLCDLEGKTRKEAARQLRLPEGTVASRLARARTMLARRLARRGFAITGGAVAALMSQQTASASVPPLLVASTIKAAGLLAAGQAVTAVAVSAKVAALTKGVLKAMLLSKIKIVTTALLAVGIIVAGVSTTGMLYHTQAFGKTATEGASPPEQDKKNSVEVKNKQSAEWKDHGEALLRFALRELEESHPGMKGSNLKDCRNCHGPLPAEDALRGRLVAESLQEKVNRLEQELQKERSERELLQLEVWILLRELQRQKKEKE